VSREALLRRHFDRDMRLIEIGPSYNPILPKADGWQTTVIDHASQGDLVTMYTGLGVSTVDRIEPVDHVWQEAPLAALLPEDMLGKYDGLVASHVGEHFPDLIGFLQNASRLLKPDGVLALALPDKRVCFDFFQPTTMTGDVLAAHAAQRTRHQKRIFFNQSAYFVDRNGAFAWSHTGNTAPFQLRNPLSLAQHAFDEADEDPASPYRDSHAWAFTPKSFELLVLELNLLGHIDWTIRAAEAAPGVEFYVWLEKKRMRLSEAETNPLRMALLADMMLETKEAIAQIEAAHPPAAPLPATPAQAPAAAAQPALLSIAVVIPLYNGARYIEEALTSVFRQALPPAEIIVVDDGSTDGGAGAAIVERLAKIHPVTFLRKVNGGQSSARNMGVRHSESDLVAFLDQDDIWYNCHLAELVKPFLEASEPLLGWVYSNLDEVDENGHMIGRDYLSSLGVVHPKRHLFDCIRQDMFVLPSAALVLREAFEAVGGFDERLCGYEDDDLFLRIFRAGYDNQYLDRALSKWRIHTASTSYTSRMGVSRIIYTHKLVDMFPNDVKRSRYYVRDLIAPRFLNQALQEYQLAVAAGDTETARTMWKEVEFLSSQSDCVPQRVVDHALRQYKAALIDGDRLVIQAKWRDLAKLAALTPNVPVRMRAALKLLRNPTVAKSLFTVRRAARPVMVWALKTG